MSQAGGKAYGLIGTLAAFPRRIARRAVERQGGDFHDRISRRTTTVVFARSLLTRWDEARIEARFDQETSAGREILSENGFLRRLGVRQAPGSATLSRQSLFDGAGMPSRVFDMLALFDAFEHDAEPFTFRDLILAKKYVMLLAGGTTWSTIAKSVQRSPSVASLTSIALHAEGDDRVYARHQAGLSELDGQVLLPLSRPDAVELVELFALAEQAEEDGQYAEAAAIYREYLANEPGNAVAHFNRGNCLRSAGETTDATHSYLAAIKRDPKFVDAWFNLAEINVSQGKIDAARRNLRQAIALDQQYADAIFNLASLEYDAGNLIEARQWWSRYLELDRDSEWGRTAARGVQFVDLQMKQKTAS